VPPAPPPGAAAAADDGPAWSGAPPETLQFLVERCVTRRARRASGCLDAHGALDAIRLDWGPRRSLRVLARRAGANRGATGRPNCARLHAESGAARAGGGSLQQQQRLLRAPACALMILRLKSRVLPHQIRFPAGTLMGLCHGHHVRVWLGCGSRRCAFPVIVAPVSTSMCQLLPVPHAACGHARIRTCLCLYTYFKTVNTFS
jgi:hypothetical protein